MTKSKNTKRALLASILSMILCMAMLVGSTFAWFTDSVTSGKNKIVAGNLDVELYHTNGNVIAEEKVGTDTILFKSKEGENVLWEPGVMVYENFTVKNVGSLALKYKLTLNADCNTVDGKSLADVLKVAILDEAFSGEREDAMKLGFKYTISDFEKSGNLAADETGKAGDTYAVVIYWEPSANDNDYNFNNERKDLDPLYVDLGVNLVATQDSVESDSFGKNYDANATQEDEVVKYTFENDSDAIGFCPVCYRTGTTAAHADHAKYLIIKDGVAEVPQTGAWLSFKDLDWQNNAYVLDYDVDLKMLATGAFIAFDAGETTTWKDLQVGFKRTESGIEVYKTLFANSLNATKLLGEIGEKIHITYTFTPKAKNLMMLATVTDGEHTYTVENTVTDFPSDTVLCWNVYTAVGDEDIYATLDNVVFSVSENLNTAKVTNALELSDALADGGEVKLTENINYDPQLPIPVYKDTVLDLNEKALGSIMLQSYNNANVEISNGTINQLPKGDAQNLPTYPMAVTVWNGTTTLKDVVINATEGNDPTGNNTNAIDVEGGVLNLESGTVVNGNIFVQPDGKLCIGDGVTVNFAPSGNTSSWWGAVEITGGRFSIDVTSKVDTSIYNVDFVDGYYAVTAK